MHRCGSGSDGEHHTDRSAYHCRTSGSRICAGRQRHDEKTGHGHCARNLFLVGMVLTIRFIMNDKIQTEREDYRGLPGDKRTGCDPGGRKNLLITANRKERKEQKKRDIALTRKEKNPNTANIKGDEHRT